MSHTAMIVGQRRATRIFGRWKQKRELELVAFMVVMQAEELCDGNSLDVTLLLERVYEYSYSYS